MVNIPDITDISRTTFLIIINAVGAVAAIAFIVAVNFGYIQPSLPLYAGVGIGWAVVLMAAVFLFYRNNGE